MPNTIQPAAIAEHAVALIKGGDSAAAIAALTPARAQWPTNELLVRTHALALAQSKQPAEALRVLQSAIKLEAASPPTLALAARLHEDTAQWHTAHSLYLRLLLAVPNQVAFWRSLWRCTSRSLDLDLVPVTLAYSEDASIDLAADPELACMALQCLMRVLTPASAPVVVALAKTAITRFFSGPLVREQAFLVLLRGAPQVARNTPAHPALTVDEKLAAAREQLRLPSLYVSSADIDAWRERYRETLVALEEQQVSLSPRIGSVFTGTAFALAYHGRDDLSLQTLRGNLLSKALEQHAPNLAPVSTGNAAPHRIAFVSKHLRDCTVGHYFKRFFCDLNDESLAVDAYALGVTDHLSEEIASKVHRFHHIALAPGDDESSDTLVRVAQQIASAGYDALIYPEIGMEPLIEKLAAIRLAPLQCALWGHPDTTGLPTIDVFFSSELMEPAEAARHYRERLYTLPRLGCAYPKPPAPLRLGRLELGLPESGKLLVCAQSSIKWSAAFLDALVRILVGNPAIKLVYFENRDVLAAHAFSSLFGEVLSKHRLSVNRQAIALPETARDRFLAILSHCELALDTFDFSGGNTTLDSLSVGLPVLTLPGQFMRGRQSMAMLELIDLPMLIAKNVDDYVAIANQVLGDDKFAANLRQNILQRNEALFDDATPIEAMRNWLRTHLLQNRQ